MALYVNVAMVNQSGDVGGLGMSRWHCQNAAGLAMSVGDVTTWHNALRTLYQAIHGNYPADLTLTVNPEVQVIEVDNAGLIQVTTNPSPPAPVVGLGSGTYPAGTGCRVNWHTATIKNRRFIRGATFFAPLTSPSFTTGGEIDSGFEGTLGPALATYLNTLTTASLTAVVYSRPTKTAPMTGATGAIVSGTVNNTPSSLRSRRS